MHDRTEVKAGIDLATYPAGAWWPDALEPQCFHFVRQDTIVGVCNLEVKLAGERPAGRLAIPKNWLCIQCRGLVSDVMPDCDISDVGGSVPHG